MAHPVELPVSAPDGAGDAGGVGHVAEGGDEGLHHRPDHSRTTGQAGFTATLTWRRPSDRVVR